MSQDYEFQPKDPFMCVLFPFTFFPRYLQMMTASNAAKNISVSANTVLQLLL